MRAHIGFTWLLHLHLVVSSRCFTAHAELSTHGINHPGCSSCVCTWGDVSASPLENSSGTLRRRSTWIEHALDTLDIVCINGRNKYTSMLPSVNALVLHLLHSTDAWRSNSCQYLEVAPFLTLTW